MATASSSTTGSYELHIDDHVDSLGVPIPLNVVSFTGKEALSKLFSFDVRITCADNLVAGSPPDRLRSRAGLHITVGNTVRHVRGIVASIVPEAAATSVISSTDVQLWKVRIVPRLWLAKQRIRSRIFQNKSVPQIVEEILGADGAGGMPGEYDVPMTTSLDQDYAARDYCMQYQESDYAFIRRILSEEGIFWYFKHNSDNEELVLLDSANAAYPALALDPATTDGAPAKLELGELSPGASPSSLLSSFELEHTVKPNALLLRDYDYERPRLDVTASAPTEERPASDYVSRDDSVEKWWTWEAKGRGSETRGADTDIDNDGVKDHQYLLAGEARDGGASHGGDSLGAAHEAAAGAQLRVYEHHCALGPTRVDGTRAQWRLDQYTRNAIRAKAAGFCHHIAPGYRFELATSLEGVNNLSGIYVVTKVAHLGADGGAVTTSLSRDADGDGNVDRAGLVVTDTAGPTYSNDFECVPETTPYRPKQKTKRRKEVIESATVVGPAGHEVHTDELGRVKVQFHWDLKGSMNENSCCFVRVMQSWSGSAFGAQFLPRVGTEVLVSFREGDHDRPVVIGSVYNGVQPYPFMPPEGQHRSGFRTRSTPGGSGYNELSFDDSAGKEQVVLRAQTDVVSFVGRDRKTNVLGSELKQVEGRQTERVTADVDRGVGGDQRLHVEGCRVDRVEGKSETTIGEDRWVEVGGAERHQIERTGWLHAGDDLTTETEGNHATVVGKHDAKRSFALHVEGRSQLQSTGITELVSPEGLRLRCGNSIVEIMEDQIHLVSDKIMLHAPGTQMELRKQGEFWIDADQQAVVKSGTVTLKGVTASLKLDAKAELGPQVSLGATTGAGSLEETERELTTIELKDEDGQPCPNQRFILVFGDGAEQSGFLDEDGKAELYLEAGATIRFPGMTEVARGAAK